MAMLMDARTPHMKDVLLVRTAVLQVRTRAWSPIRAAHDVVHLAAVCVAIVCVAMVCGDSDTPCVLFLRSNIALLHCMPALTSQLFLKAPPLSNAVMQHLPAARHPREDQGVASRRECVRCGVITRALAGRYAIVKGVVSRKCKIAARNP